MKQLILLLFLPSLLALVSTPQSWNRVESSPSQYVGSTFVTEFGLGLLSNAPLLEGLNAPHQAPWKASHSLGSLFMPCTGCFVREKIKGPIRVEYIPKGARYTVISSYRIVSGLSSTDTLHQDILVIEDQSGRRAEVPSIFLEKKLWEKKKELASEDALSKFIEKAQESIASAGHYDHKFIGDAESAAALISDFELENDATILSKSKGYRKKFTVIRFKTLTAFLTFHRYIDEWVEHQYTPVKRVLNQKQ